MSAATTFGGRFVRHVGAAGRRVRLWFAPDRDHPPLYEGSVVDDFLWGQTFNPVMRLVWRWGRRRRPTGDGVSVVIVSWNTAAALAQVVDAVRCHSPADTEIIVVDNGSDDGTREWLRTTDQVDRRVLLPFNVGHGRGLDIGFALARTPLVVTLDSDAFPYSSDWLDVLRSPMRRDSDIVAAGMWGRRDRLHPACAVFARAAYFRARTSFTNYTPWMDRREEPVFGENSWDTAELLFERLGRDRVELLAIAPSEFGGITMADVVYHHEQMTTVQIDEPLAVGDQRRAAWTQAVAELCGSAR